MYAIYVQIVALLCVFISLFFFPVYERRFPFATYHSDFAYLFLDAPLQLADLLLFYSGLVGSQDLRSYYLSPVLGVHLYVLVRDHGFSKLKEIDFLEASSFHATVLQFLAWPAA